MTEQKVRWGIAGLGKIAHRFAADLTQHVDNACLYAVSARDEQRADAFAQQYQAEHTYSSYQAMAEDPNVDAVYIATIHPFHKSMVELFLDHGKHVLVEKPAFTNTQDWDDMKALADKQDLLLMEAMKSVTFPAYRALRDFIQKNSIEIESIEAAFGNWHEFDVQQQIFNPDLCGGATLDVGVYALWLYADLCQLKQSEIQPPSVTYQKHNNESKVDETVEFTFSHSIQGKIGASISQNLKRVATIRGSDVEIVIQDKWWNPTVIDVTYKGEHTQISHLPAGGGFEFEASHLSQLIIDGKSSSDFVPHETSRQVIALMERSLKDNGFSHLLHASHQ
ncbi:Gfo/Idh/MocA family oxidoreductase [Vibrio sp. Isolate24]|uniref:Gfo/Idh/MocA family protein n=1 Tax=Vibrio sp. Isolate24 TaxID=2908534 RepID=UPI001EFDD189|nr:Gfo/Idh/MocA family oxidoreductase [Vibrio sp. Isolate24]MCG9677629.1 Gfo/Idh/MocA family oxidoreductase [Vibrio sp. Isolate24]